MKVRSVMTRQVHSCQPHHRLTEAARIMWDHDCGFVPVVENDRRLVGVITDRDVCMAAFFHGERLGEISVATPMAKWTVACAANDPVGVAVELMRFYRLRRLPVVDDSNRLVGVLSLRDLARTGQHEREVAEIFAALADATREESAPAGASATDGRKEPVASLMRRRAGTPSAPSGRAAGSRPDRTPAIEAHR